MAKSSFGRRALLNTICLILCPCLLFGVLFYLPRFRTETPPVAVDMGEEQPMLRVILDPGHGGVDGGASSLSGTKEKELNLRIALLVAQILEGCGAQVILTRNDDSMLTTGGGESRKMQDLLGRLQVMQEHPDALLVSIHMNHFSSPDCRGAQIWYAEGVAGSERLANSILTQIKKTVQPENNRKNKAAGESIFLLHRAQTPAVLVECGFLSSPEEAALLEDEGYEKELAGAIAIGILAWEKELT